MKQIITLIALFLLATQITIAKEKHPYQDKSRPIDERVKDLLSRMTIEEKFWQVYMMPGDLSGGKEKYKHGIFGFQVHTVGASNPELKQLLTYNPALTAVETVKKANEIQRYFVEDTRLGIPVILFDEALHGLVRGGATAYPQSIALAATFDTTLMSRVSQAIAKETRSRGIRQILSPVVNLATDVRWGRVEETYGEDPYLSSLMGENFVKSFEQMGVITTPKHFVANSGDGGRDSNPIHFTERYLEETHLAPFKACFQKGGSQSVMTAYNMLDGVPCTANSWLLIDKLRKEWGFDGFTIADADAVGIIHKLHHTVTSFGDAGSDAINNGLDVIFQTTYDEHLPFLEACLDGRVKPEALNRAVTQVLKAKFRLGLFDNPYAEEEGASKWNNCTEHRELAYEAACKSMVLLKNNGDRLPLTASAKRIALIGEDVTEARLGGYSGPGCNKVNILDGFRNSLKGTNKEVVHTLGCKRNNPSYVSIPSEYLFTPSGKSGLQAKYYPNITFEGKPAVERVDKTIHFSWTLFAPDPALPVDWFSAEWTGFLEAPESGLVQLGLEGNDGYQMWIDGKKVIDNPTKSSFGSQTIPYQFEKGKRYALRICFYENTRNARIRLVWNVGVKNEDDEIKEAVQLAQQSDVAIVVAGIEEGEFLDRGYLTLPGRQEELIKQVAKTGTPTVVVLIGGSAVVMSSWMNDVDAILAAWYPGERGGDAVADVLLGRYNPSGKLPITFPIDEAQLPLNYSHKPTGRSDDYLNLTGEPLFPFGHGLSYSQFAYSDLRVSFSEQTQSYQVHCSVTNTSTRDANETVQLYMRDMIASVTQPITKLIGMKSCFIPAGKKVDVVLDVTHEALSLLNKEMDRVVEPGDFRLMVGRSSKDIRLKTTLHITSQKVIR